MSVLKYTVYGRTPPTRNTDKSDHCCDCSMCWKEPDFKECPYMIPQFCMVCNNKSIFALSLDRESINPELGNRQNGSVCFWVCGKHSDDEKVLEVLRSGVPSSLARNKRKLISYVRQKTEEENF